MRGIEDVFRLFPNVTLFKLHCLLLSPSREVSQYSRDELAESHSHVSNILDGALHTSVVDFRTTWMYSSQPRLSETREPEDRAGYMRYLRDDAEALEWRSDIIDTDSVPELLRSTVAE